MSYPISGLGGMSSGRHAFRLNDAVRLVKAAIQAGLPPDRLRLIHDKKKDQVIVEVVAETSQRETLDRQNPWNDVLKAGTADAD
jgi:hypothetical protein